MYALVETSIIWAASSDIIYTFGLWMRRPTFTITKIHPKFQDEIMSDTWWYRYLCECRRLPSSTSVKDSAVLCLCGVYGCCRSLDPHSDVCDVLSSEVVHLADMSHSLYEQGILYTINCDWTKVIAVIDDYCVCISREVIAVSTHPHAFS